MTEQEAKIYVKGQLKSYLEGRGINTSRNFRCFSGKHTDRHASMSYRNNRVKCFACGYSGDMFDVLATTEYSDLSGRKLFLKVYERFGIEIEFNKAKKGEIPTHLPESQREEEDLTNYISTCALQADKTDYFKRRGLSQSVIERFGLGYDEHFCRGTGRNSWRAAIIPNGAGGFIARNTDFSADEKNRYRKAGKSVIFNVDAFFQSESAPVWLVEGEIDALSLETIGASCSALGSVSNADQLIHIFENKRPRRRMIVAMDADKAGIACTEKLAAALRQLKIEYMIAPEDIFQGKKDANEALIGDATALAQAVRDVEESFDTVIRADEVQARQEYVSNFSARAHLESFIGELTANTPVIRTGFNGLNEVLGGGLFPGLICIGAVSTLGKTTYVLQLADSISKAGQDVLFFSLEMSRSELMSKSISRLTLKKTIDSRRSPVLAKSARDITTAERYETYTEEELMLIDEAIKEYWDISGRIFVVEGMGDLGVAEIRAQAEEHVAKMKKTPVIIVDYLQLVAPYAERLSDKQNTDRNVLELRRLARDLKTPVIAISSFSRANYQTSATMAHYKESGLIEYSSDVLIALQYIGIGDAGFDLNAAMQQNPRSIELLILKNRFGVTGGKIQMKYYPRYNYFSEENR